MRKVILISVILCLARAVHAAPLPESIKIVMDNNYPPYVFQDSTGSLQGILIDQWKLWERKTGIKAELHGMDWGEAMRRMRAGEFDVIDTIFKTEERTSWLDFTSPYARLEVPIFFDKDISGISNASSLKGFAVGAKAGDDAVDVLKRHGVDSLLLFNSYETIIKAARDHKITVFVVDKPPALYYLYKFGIYDHFKYSAPLNVGEFHRAVKKGNRDMMKVVEDGFGLISADELNRIDKKWSGAVMEGSYRLRYIAIAAGSLCLLVLILLAWNYVLRKAVNARTAELKYSEELFSQFMKFLPAAAFIKDSDGRVLYVNQYMTDIFGAKEWLDNLTTDLFPGEIGRKMHADDRAALEKGHSVVEEVLPLKDGSIHVYQTQKFAIHRADKPSVLGGLAIDVSERVAMENSLRTSQELFVTAFRSGPLLMTISDIETGRYQEVNENFERISGFSREEAIGKSSVELGWLTSENRSRLISELRTHGRVSGMEMRLMKKNGEQPWCLYYAEIIEIGGERKLLSIAEDISDRKRAEEELKESEERLRRIIDQSPISMAIVRFDGTIEYINRRAIETFGYLPKDIPNMERWWVQAYPDEQYRAEVVAQWMGLVEKAMTRGEEIARREYRVTCKDGKVKTMIIFGVQVSGKVLVMFEDITDRKRAEEERLNLERQLLHAQKLESLGVLTGGIAHDFNNLLMAILGNLDLALTETPPASTSQKYLRQALNASHRAAELVNRMLAYSGRGSFVVRTVNLSDLVTENAALLNTAISKTAVLTMRLSSHMLPVQADVAQVQQVIMNLITNASEALDEKAGEITLATGTMECDSDYLSRSRLVEKPAPGKFAWFEVSDTGMGMSSEVQQKLFDPFFTTKFTGRGLGMAAVLGIVRGHSGAIMVESEPGRGSTIRVLFPVGGVVAEYRRDATGDTAHQEKPGAAGSLLGGTVLVVDDDTSVRDVCVAMLVQLGCRVTVAADGEEAIRIVREKGDEIKLVLLDLMMPHLDGVDTCRELLRIRPDLKVILSSGYSEQEVSGRFRGKGFDGFIQKPYRMEVMEKTVRSVIEKSDDRR